MKKTLVVDSAFHEMRIDRYLRNKLGKIPQSLIEKNLKKGKIKLNKKKVKSSIKIKLNDKIELFDFKFEEKIINSKIKFQPTNIIINCGPSIR